MIANHQPTIFSNQVVAAISSAADGTMRERDAVDTDEVRQNLVKFLAASGMPAERRALVRIVYEGDNYCRYAQATAGERTVADALVTTELNVPLVLPLADCTGAILHDPVQGVLMVSHLGRHSTEQFGAIRSVEYLTTTYGTQPSDLIVWLSPSPNGVAYPLWAFNNRSFTEVLLEQFNAAGVPAQNIQASDIDTVTNPDYFSHSEFLKGKQVIDGRYAIAAMLSSSV